MKKARENHQQLFQFIVKRKYLKVYQVACANGKGIEQNIKNDIKIHHRINEQSKQNMCSKNDAKMIKTIAKMEPRGEPK